MTRVLAPTLLALALTTPTLTWADGALEPHELLAAELTSTAVSPAPSPLSKQGGKWYLGDELIDARAANELLLDCEPCRKRRATSKALTIPGTLVLLAGCSWNLVASANNDFAQMTQATGVAVLGAAMAIPGASIATPKRMASIYNEHNGLTSD